jgi:hypothetical protein
VRIYSLRRRYHLPYPNPASIERSSHVQREVAGDFVEALWKLEEEEDVEPLVEIHTEDCEVGNVSVPGTLRPPRLTRVLEGVP